MCLNFNIDEEDIPFKFEAVKTNWNNDNYD